MSYLAFEAIEAHGTATTGGRLLVLTQLAADLVVAAALAAGWGRAPPRRRGSSCSFPAVGRLGAGPHRPALGGPRPRGPGPRAPAGDHRLDGDGRRDCPGGVGAGQGVVVALLPGLFVERQHRAARGHWRPWPPPGWCGWPSGASAGCSMSCSSGSRGWQVESTIGAVVYVATGAPCRPKGGGRIGAEPAGSGRCSGWSRWPPSPPPGGWPPAGPMARRRTGPVWPPSAPCLSWRPSCRPSTSVAPAVRRRAGRRCGGARPGRGGHGAHRGGGPRLRRLRGRLALVGVGRRGRNALLLGLVGVVFARLATGRRAAVSGGPTVPVPRPADRAPA